jgi:hypothetical protein
MTRVVTNKLHEAMDGGLLNARDVADMALQWLSEAEVEEMARQNDLLPYLFYEEDEEEEDEIFFDEEDEELFEEE